MKEMLSPLRLNELLGFVRLSHHASPEPSMSILPFDIASAARRSTHNIIQQRVSLNLLS